MPLTPEQEKQIPTLAEAIAKVREISAKKRLDATDREQLARLETQIGNIATKSREAAAQRAAEFEEGGAASVLDALDGGAGRKLGAGVAGRILDTLVETKSQDPDLLAAQEHIDRSYIMSTALGKPITELKYFWDGIKREKYLKKNLDVADVQVTLTATGWQPAVFTQRMIEKIRLALTVANLHSRINMPADPYRFPVEGPDALVYLVPERGNVDADVLGSPAGAQRVPAGFTDTGASNLIMSSKKIGTRVVLSNEMDEDSFIPILPYIEGKIAQAMADNQDNVCVNGDSAGTLDGGSFAATDPRLAWSGYRKFLSTVSTAFVDNGGGLTIDISKLRQVRQLMSKYAISVRDVVWLVGPAGYIKFLSISAGAHESPVQTLDKYGAAATILTGELARVDGIPVIVTEFMGPGGGEMLNASGAYDGVTTTFTEALLVRPSAMIFGDRRAAQMKRREIIETDQQVLVLLQRLTFMNLYPTVPVVGGLYNIKKV
jgi:HK97 family phage major capsid protein